MTIGVTPNAMARLASVDIYLRAIEQHLIPIGSSSIETPRAGRRHGGPVHADPLDWATLANSYNWSTQLSPGPVQYYENATGYGRSAVLVSPSFFIPTATSRFELSSSRNRVLCLNPEERK
ncbi:hypothetical protein CRG98_025970, partial [Punica granatum]